MNNEVTHDEYVIPPAGMRLRKAREQLGVSQQEIAEKLCLKISIIRDIEEDKIPTNLALTFLLGYIQSYARLVYISEKELNSIMKEFKDKVGMTKSFPLKDFSSWKYRKNSNNWLTSFVWLTLFVIVGLVGSWWLTNQGVKQKEKTIVTTNRSTSRLNSIDNALPDKTIVNDNPRHISEIDNNTQMIKNRPNTETSNTDPNALVMNFTDNCWLEIKDLTGKILFSGFQHKNDNLNLVGQSTYKLKIGAPKAIKIQYLGKIIDLSSFIKTKQVAHLSLSAER